MLNFLSRCIYIYCEALFVYFLYIIGTSGIITYLLFILFPGLIIVIIKDFLSLFSNKILIYYPLKIYQILCVFVCSILYLVFSYTFIFVEVNEMYIEYDIVYIILASIGSIYLIIRTISMMKGR